MERLISEGMAPAEALAQALSRNIQTNSGFRESRTDSREGSLQPECADCKGTGFKIVPRPDGFGRMAVPCRHTIDKRIARELARVAARDSWARIDALEVCDDPTKCVAPADLQRRTIHALRAAPSRSLAFFGPSGFAKTTYLAALWHHAVTKSQGRGCYYTLMCDLVRDLRDFELGRDDSPYLSRQVIREAAEQGQRPSVFLDEFDKVNATDFVRNAIHELIDEIYGIDRGTPEGVQLVIATNFDRDEFTNIWGSSILRRIEAVCTPFDFFAEIERKTFALADTVFATR
jgi:hypothetical protein